MKNNNKKPYFFDKEKSGFTKNDFELIDAGKFHFTDNNYANSLNNNIYLYGDKQNCKFNFYLIDYKIKSEEELKALHLNIFSEDKADVYIVKQDINGQENYAIKYAKTTPNNIVDIDNIPTNAEDEELLNKISKKSIDTGLFWIFYNDIIQKAPKTNVRNELVKILSVLRINLLKEISANQYVKTAECEKFVQALIDRTLFIKFLEDRHIINSYFYGDNIVFKTILKSKNADNVNQLFKKVHKIFNNQLFEDPTIDNEVLTEGVLQAIIYAIEGVHNNQLTLFDLKFDIIPIESISLIYEIFLDEIQRKNGIYYTPSLLTNFITEKTITKKGKIIDPACGSGAFLISAYKRLLKLDNTKFNSVIDKINHRTKLIKDYIFGIEKEEVARRLSVFSLYLSILDDLTVKENDELKNLLQKEENYPLFNKNIGENILCNNTFEPNKFDKEKFDFIVGNPPWKKDFDKDDYHAVAYLKNNKSDFSGKSELSQLFQHKAKTWSKKNTRYGFVVNTSNYTNEESKFQDYFYQNFNIENMYEVTDLKLFTASEPAIVCIYTNNPIPNNVFTLNILKANNFTNLFKKILIIEDDNISINQSTLVKTDELKATPLKSYLVGNIEDNKIIEYLEGQKFENFEKFILKDENNECFIKQGVTIYSLEKAGKVYGIDINSLSTSDKIRIKNRFYNDFSSNTEDKEFYRPYLKNKDYSNFRINTLKFELYLPKDISNLERARTDEILKGKRILIPRKGVKLKAIYLDNENKEYLPTSDINTLKLNNSNYYLFTAILNSKLVEYFLKLKFWHRAGSSFPRINETAIPQIPIPKNRSEELVNQIEKLSEQFTKGIIAFKDKEDEFNELIYNLYGIGIIEKQRINDFFITDNQKVKTSDLENYAKEICEYFSDFIKQEINTYYEIFDEKSLVKGICVVKIYFGKEQNKYPKANKVGRYLLLELMKNATNKNILSLRERIYGKNTIYFVKDNRKKSWSLTQAGEDAICEINKINKFNTKNNSNE